MITTAVIAFREFLEALLISGVFWGISRRLQLNKEVEIAAAVGSGLLLSLFLSVGVYVFGDHARLVLTEQNAESLESYLLIFSGAFISYVVFSLHDMLRKGRAGRLLLAHEKLKNSAFDISLFVTIMLLVVREGFEIALFSASVALFSDFFENVTGLLVGFGAACIAGALTLLAYVRIPIGKILKATEYVIVLLGASLTQNGMTKLLEVHFGVHIGTIMPLHMPFLPDEETLTGHLLQGFAGVDREFSAVRLSLMLLYIGLVYTVFLRKKSRPARSVRDV